MPKISVIVPTYNVEAYIDECLKSLKIQSFQDFEVLIIDDGSKQNEYKIIEPYLHQFPNQFLYHRKENGGYGSALEVGIKRAQSDYILVCDPDDYLELNALKKLYALVFESSADVVCSARYLVDDDKQNKRYEKMFDSSIVSIYSKKYLKNEKDFGHVYHIENAPHGKLFKRSLLLDLKFPHHLSNTDTILYFGAIFKAQTVVFTDEALSNYRMYRVGNTVTDVKESVINGLIRSHLETLRISQYYPNLPNTFYKQMLIAYFYILSRIQRLDADQSLVSVKFHEASQILDYLKTHRSAIVNQYSNSISNTRRVQYALLLIPFYSHFAQKKLLKNILKSRSNASELSEVMFIDESIHTGRKVSIIVPVYNVENYLERCLDSLIEQDYDDYEIICVNDGSTDTSLDILYRYQKLNPKIFNVYTKINGGLSDARNFGLDKAQGDYVCFIDSDDWVDKTLIKSMVSKAKLTQSDVVVCDMVYEYENGEKKLASGGEFSIIDVEEYPEIMFINNSACNKLFTMEIFREIRFVKGLWYEDLATIPTVLLNAKRVSKIEESYYHYFQRQGSIVHSPNPKIFDIYRALDLTKVSVLKSMHSKLLNKGMNRLYLVHGLDLTTLRIRSYQTNRIEYLKKNMILLNERYPNWYFNSYIIKQGYKKVILYTLLRLNLTKLALALFDRKGQA